MRYATTPTWTFVMLIVMGVGFGFGGLLFITLMGPPTGTLVGGVWIVMAAGFVFFSVRAIAGRRRDVEIEHTGAAATATVLSAGLTGMVINNVPQWNLRLRIEGAGAPYETTMKLLTYSPADTGARFPVRIDPRNRQHVVMADDAPAATSSGAPPSTPIAPVQIPVADLGDVRAAVLAALNARDGTNVVVNADGSRTITSTSVTTSARDAADTVRLLADLDRMHADGTIDDAQFAALKQQLLGGSDGGGSA